MNALGGRWKSQEAKNRALAGLLSAPHDARWRGKLSIPEKAHPMVRQLFELMNSDMACMEDISSRAGIQPSTISNWRTRSSPSLVLFQAALNALGYDLSIVPLVDVADGKRGRPAKEKQI